MRQTGKSWTWLQNGKNKRKTETHLIAAKNIAKRTNDIKAKADNTQPNSKCKLCSGKYERVNCVKSERRQLVQKAEKTRHNYVQEIKTWPNGIWTNQNSF